MVKRAIDILVSILLAPVAIPIVITAIIAIRLESPAPAIFRQTRVGRGRTPFVIWKLRTMRADADNLRRSVAHLNEASPFFKMTNDPRITRVGRWLRRCSIDELPQLLNVLRGDMSLVGPRPLCPDEADALPLSASLRFSVLPGLTGPWQVEGRKRKTSPHRRIELDNEYAVTASPLLDLRIIASTFSVVLSGR